MAEQQHPSTTPEEIRERFEQLRCGIGTEQADPVVIAHGMKWAEAAGFDRETALMKVLLLQAEKISELQGMLQELYEDQGAPSRVS